LSDEPEFSALLAELAAAHASIEDGQREKFVARQHRHGKLTARERIDALLDDSSFREMGPLALGTSGASRNEAPGDGMILGLGAIDGRGVGVVANDFTALGGSKGITGKDKAARLTKFCIESGIPLIRLADSGGQRVQEGLTSRHFVAGSDDTQTLVDASGWIPQVSAILGPGFAGPAIFASLNDFVVGVRGIGSMGVAGPPIVKAGLGVDIDKSVLGDLDMHAEAGNLDLVVATEDEAMAAIRAFLSYLPSNAAEPLPVTACSDPADRREDDLLKIVPTDHRRAYDVRDVIAAIADRESLFEIRPARAANMVTAFARMDGRPVGFIANQPMHLAGSLDVPAVEKASHFVSMCDAFGLPLIYLIDTPGFQVGLDAEQTGLARRAGNMAFELGRATVPRISIVMRKAFGFAYVAMNGGRSFGAELTLAWPTAQIAAMSVEGAVDAAYAPQYKDAEDPEAKRAEIIAELKKQTGWEPAAEGFGIDDVIDPRDTRLRIIETLSICAPRRRTSLPPKRHPITPV